MNNFRYLFVGGVLLHLLTLLFYDDTGYQLSGIPLALGALAAAGGAALSDIANNRNKANAEYSVELQKDLMDYSWNKYNSPKAQAKAYADAGLNPSVAFGQGGMSAPVAPSVSAPELQQGNIGLSSNDITQSILTLAEASKAGSEEAGVNLDNIVKRESLTESIKAVGLKNKWTQAQIEQIDQNCALMSGQFEEIQQRIDLMKQEERLTEKKVNWFDRHMSAEVAYLKSSKEYQDVLKGLTDQQKQLLENTMDDLTRFTTYQADQMQKIVGLLDKYGDAQAIVGMISQVVGSASDLIGSITSLKNVGKAKEIITDAITTKSDGSSSRTYTKRTSR